MPLPFHPNSKIGDLAEDDVPLQRGINTMILVLNWLHLNMPAKVPRDFCIYNELTAEQRAVLKNLVRLTGEWSSIGPIAAADMGRAAGKIENIEEQLRSLSAVALHLVAAGGSSRASQSGPRVEKSKQKSSVFGDVQLAKDIESKRLHFGGPPTFDPTNLLEPTTREIFQHPIDCAMDPADSNADPPHVQTRGSRKEILALLDSLDRTNRLQLFRAEDVLMTHRAGLFSLMKNLSTDRLILDSRPFNCLEYPLNQWTQSMGSVQPLLDTFLRSDNVLLCSGEDLKDYYYYYRVSDQRARRNAICIQLTPKEASRYKCFSNAPQGAAFYVPALATMAMGDLNAVEIGQQSHMILTLLSGVQMSELLTLRGRAPRGPIAFGVVIDDWIAIEQVPRNTLNDQASIKVANKMVQLYHKHGLLPNDSKRFRSEKHAKFLGASIDGESGLIRAQLERVIPLSFVTAEVARLGRAERKLLEILAGGWTSVCQLRKRTMCLLQHIFDEIQRFDYGQIFELTRETTAELWTLVALAPLFCTDLRTALNPRLVLVDASSELMAEVECPLPPVLAEELVRHKLTRSAWSRMLSPWKALLREKGKLAPEDEVPDGETPCAAHLFWSALVRSQRFSTAWVRKTKRAAHINESELEAALRAEERSGRMGHHSRLLLGSDSQVTLGALVKGRSSSHRLNGLLRQSLPTILGYNQYTAAQYISTRENVADDPTRHKECREPSLDVPHWLYLANNGDFSQLDVFLQDAGLDERSLARLPKVHELPPEEPDLTPCRQQRRRGHVQLQRELRHRARCQKSSMRTGSIERRPTPPVAAVSGEPWLPQHTLSDDAVRALKQLPRSQFVLPPGGNLDELLKRPGHLDLCSGCRGAATALSTATGRWTLCWDIKHSSTEDLLSADVQHLLLELLQMGCFLSVSAGPVCSSFSRAVRPAVRSRDHPAGLKNLTPSMTEKVRQGNSFSTWLASFIDEALLLRCIVWVENPSTSFLWMQEAWIRLQAKWRLDYFTTDYCCYGTRWRKRTRFLGNFVLAGQKKLCQCRKGFKHLQLKGYSSKHKKSWTKVAESYPSRLTKLLAAAVCESLKPVERRQSLSIAGCAKTGTLRVGEASNPGPRVRRDTAPRPDINEVQLVGRSTLVLQSRAMDRFVNWLRSELTPEAWEEIRRHPHMQLHFLLG